MASEQTLMLTVCYIRVFVVICVTQVTVRISTFKTLEYKTSKISESIHIWKKIGGRNFRGSLPYHECFTMNS